MQNAVVAAEDITTLGIVRTVAKNIGVNECRKLKVHADCKIVSDMLTLDRIKASQFALDRGGIISKIMQLENGSDIEFECAQAKTRNDDEERGHGYERSWC